MQGLFALLVAFEHIDNPAVQQRLLQHSLDLREMTRQSSVQLLQHNAHSASELMALLRKHAPKSEQDDHLLVLQGPFHDMVSF